MMQAVNGYLEGGHFTPFEAITPIPRRVPAVLVFNAEDAAHEKRDTWAELDRIVMGMDEKPRLEDFPRSQLGREFINFDEV